MIKVIVAVSGLALVEMMSGKLQTDSITIHFPETEGFAVPTAPALDLEDHDLWGELKSKDWPTPDTPFRLTVHVPWNGAGSANNLDELGLVPSLDKLHGGKRSVRAGCKSDVNSLTTCQAKDKTGAMVRLLAAQVGLEGTWTLRAIDTEGIDHGRRRDPMAPIVGFRSVSDDIASSQPHPAAGVQFANTLVFEATIADYAGVKVTLAGLDVPYKAKADLSPEVTCKAYDPTMPDCILIRLDNQRACAFTDTCVDPPAWVADGADHHFLQLYRLLATYRPDLDQSTIRPVMPYHLATGMGGHGPGGASGARCYPGSMGP